MPVRVMRKMLKITTKEMEAKMLEKIEKPDIETVELKSNGTYGKFVLEPLERGYGTIIAFISPRCSRYIY